MKKKELIEFFGGRDKAARAIGITGSSISQWGEDVPANRMVGVRLAMDHELRLRAKAEKARIAREKRQQAKLA